MERDYVACVDGEEFCRVTLTPEQYTSQYTRDIVRRSLAHTYRIPMHYIRLKWANKYIFVTDMETGKTIRRLRDAILLHET